MSQRETERKIKTHKPPTPGRRSRTADDRVLARARWKRLRGMKLRMNPLCEDPEDRHTRPTRATEVDHVVSRRAAPERTYEIDNLQSLCRSCHARKTRREDGWIPPKILRGA